MGLSEQLKASRFPNLIHNRPGSRGINKLQEVAKQGAREALVNNRNHLNESLDKRQKEEKETKIRDIINGEGKIKITSKTDICDFLMIAVDKNLNEFQENGFSIQGMFDRYEAKTLLSYFATRLNLEQERLLDDKNMGFTLEHIRNQRPALIKLGERMGIYFPERKMIVHGPQTSSD